MFSLRVGTRASRLAVAQTTMVCEALKQLYPDVQIEIKTFSTAGDRKRDIQSAVRDKRDWIIDIENALLNNEIDFAIHSSKDVPVEVDKRTSLTSVLGREERNDVIIFRDIIQQNTPREHNTLLRKDQIGLDIIPFGGVIGTSSIRRKAQILRVRPDIRVVELRGNVPTRLARLQEKNDLNAIVLAVAGLKRLNIDIPNMHLLPINEFVPAVNQGILVAQYVLDNDSVTKIMSAISNQYTQFEWNAERLFIAEIGADCRSAVGVCAVAIDDTISMRAHVLHPDGRSSIYETIKGPLTDVVNISKELAKRCLSAGAHELLNVHT